MPITIKEVLNHDTQHLSHITNTGSGVAIGIGNTINNFSIPKKLHTEPKVFKNIELIKVELETYNIIALILGILVLYLLKEIDMTTRFCFLIALLMIFIYFIIGIRIGNPASLDKEPFSKLFVYVYPSDKLVWNCKEYTQEQILKIIPKKETNNGWVDKILLLCPKTYHLEIFIKNQTQPIKIQATKEGAEYIKNSFAC